MNKRWLILILLAAVALVCAGCGNTPFNTYPNHEKYAAGDTVISSAVTALEIDWVDGSVNVQYGNQSNVTVAETAKTSLKESEKLHWWLEGTTLHVQYAESGLINMRSLDKQLTVTLPENTVLTAARIASVSGKVTLSPLYAGNADVSAVSGGIAGRIAADTLKLSTVSGAIDVEAAASEMNLNTTSGRIGGTVENGKTLAVNSVSGAVDLKVERMLESVRVNTVSGGVTLRLPNDAIIAAELGSVSGGIQNALGSLPSADCRVSVNTVSGGIKLEKNEK